MAERAQQALFKGLNPTIEDGAPTLRRMPIVNPSMEIFRAGTHVAADGTPHTITRADLIDLAASYDASVSEAPIVIGHPVDNAPAHGWIAGLKVEGDTLIADASQVNPAFAEMVKSGAFKKRSASFWGKQSPGNPTPGKLYLRHVGFLGAQPPAVKGMRDVAFGADTAGVLDFSGWDRRWVFREIAAVFRRVRDWFVEKEGAERADQLLPSWTVDSIATAGDSDSAGTISYAQPSAASIEDISMSEPNQQLQQRQAELDQRDAQIKAREQAIAQAEAKQRRQVHVDYAEGLVQSGTLLPRHKAPVVELLVSLDGSSELNFADGSGQTVKKTGVEALKGLLDELPKQIDFSEKSAKVVTDAATVDFAAPSNVPVDAARLQLHSKALAYQRQHQGVSYVDAVAAVGG